MVIEPYDGELPDHKPMAKWSMDQTLRDDRSYFIAWDGEGITDGKEHKYVLLGASTGNYVQSESLSTIECFDVMLETAQEHKRGTHIAFAFDYDVNMILRDVPYRVMQRLVKEGSAYWRDYRIEWRSKKWFQVSIKGVSSIKIWDIFTFFGCSFVDAMKQYNVATSAEHEQIASGKNHRNAFTFDEVETLIKPYWQLELKYYVQLADKLKIALFSADLRIRQWHGPGAVASYIFKRRKTENIKLEQKPEIQECARYGFAGGRFELFQAGYYEGKVYEYDINSAYPAAIAQLPNLVTGEWEHIKNPTLENYVPFGIYRISYMAANMSEPGRMFRRSKDGRITYPVCVNGWFWGPEIKSLFKYSHATVHEAWIYHDDGTRPFAWVAEMYDKRLQWKTDGNPAQLAYKLGLNSLYGKMAQRVGWEKFNGPPRWHQLEWAGWITAYCRSMVGALAMWSWRRGGLIAIETDAVFTTVPCDILPVSKKLGEWEPNTFDGILYIQNGLYFALENGKWSAKIRGLDPDSVPFDNAYEYLQHDHKYLYSNKLTGMTTRFCGFRQAQYTHISNWRKWTRSPRELLIGGHKRLHIPPWCKTCIEGKDKFSDGLHMLFNYPPEEDSAEHNSHPHHIPWQDGIDEPLWWEEMSNMEGLMYV